VPSALDVLEQLLGPAAPAPAGAAPPARATAPAAQPGGQQGGLIPASALEWRGRERRLLKAAQIEFPDVLLKEGVEVDVEAVFTVAASGQVTGVSIERSSGYATVDRAVEQALLSYLFEESAAGEEDQGRVQFRFRLARAD
jgi:TonB family protein